MSKMEALWTYQQLDIEKDRLERESLYTPTRAKLTKLHGFLTEQQSSITKMQKDMEQKEEEISRLEELEEKLTRSIDLEDSEYTQMAQDDECTAEEFTESRKSYQQLQSSIDSTRKELNALIKWVEATVKEYKATRQRAGKAKKEYDAVRLVCEQEVAAAKAPIDEATKKLIDFETNVEPMLLSAYRRVKKNHSTPMAPIVQENRCGGCNMSLPTVVVKRIAGGQGIVECENCGRILFAMEQGEEK